MAGPITWKALQPISTRDSVFALHAAGQSGNAAVASMENILKQHQATEQANWDNQANLNTRAGINQYQGIEDLGAFNQQRDELRTNLLSQYGAQINEEDLKAAEEAQLTKLRGLASGQATAYARQVGQETGSEAAAMDAYIQKMTELGAKPDFANTSVNDFKETGMSPLQQRWTEEAKQVTQEATGMLSNYDLLRMPVGEAKEKIRQQLGDKAQRVDWAAFDSAATNAATRQKTVDDFTKEERRTLGEGEAFAIVQEQGNGEITKEVTDFIKANYDDPGDQLAIVDRLQKRIALRSTLNTTQLGEVKRAESAINTKYKLMLNEIDSTQKLLADTIERSDPLNGKDEEFKQKMANITDQGGVIEYIASKADDINQLANWLPTTIINDNKLKDKLQTLRDNMIDPKDDNGNIIPGASMPPAEVDEALMLALEDVGGTRERLFGSNGQLMIAIAKAAETQRQKKVAHRAARLKYNELLTQNQANMLVLQGQQADELSKATKAAANRAVQGKKVDLSDIVAANQTKFNTEIMEKTKAELEKIAAEISQIVPQGSLGYGINFNEIDVAEPHQRFGK